VRGGLAAALLCLSLIGAWPGMALGASPETRTPPAGTPPAGTTPAGTTPAGTTPAGTTPAGTTPAGTATANTTQSDPRSALVVFLSPGQSLAGRSEGDAIERELASIPSLSTGILSATQGTYKADQLLLDMTQGARVSYSAYNPAYPPSLESLTFDPPPSAHIAPWPAVLRRAESAPQLLEPGLLAASTPGGAAYAAPYGVNDSGSIGTAIDVSRRKTSPVTIDWPLAADRSGKIAAVSFGSASTLLARIGRLGASHRLVVADLPAGRPGYADLRTLAAGRRPGELLGVVQSAREGPGEELLWTAFAGLGRGGRTLTSQTTNQKGMVAAVDIAPTILEHLGLPVPAEMRGRSIRTDGPLDDEGLRALKSRLGVLASRRLPAVAWLVATWALLLAVARLPLWSRERASMSSEANGRPTRASPVSASDERRTLASAAGERASLAGERRVRGAWAMRVGALALMWTPVAALVPAALQPSRTAEFALIVVLCFALGALTDRLVPWPRAPVAPAVAAVLALSVDALAGTQLLIRSLLGPNPEFGARFYGIGNELKSALAVLVFAAVAGALYPAVRSRRAATAMAGAGILLAIVEGSARIGAGVGGVILVSAGTAVATVMLLPGTFDRKRLLIVMGAPLAGLAMLAAIDLATAHGGGHFTGSVLDARSAGDIRDIVVRRYGAAYDELKNHLMPVATALALIASAVAVRRRDRVCAPVDSDPAWIAALSGGLTAGVIGALTEDSGPVLLVVAVFLLACVLSYLWGKPLTYAREAVDRARQGRTERSVLRT
jgi:hypothetical protein